MKENDTVNLDIFGEIFKYKKVTAGDELNWIDDYTERYTEVNKEGKEVKKARQNLKNLIRCKLRNIVQLPFDQATLTKISGLEKFYKDYSSEEKDRLFGLLQPSVMDELIKKIDASRKNKKKN